MNVSDCARAAYNFLAGRGRLSAVSTRRAFELGYAAAWVQWQRKERLRHLEDVRKCSSDIGLLTDREVELADLPDVADGWVEP